MTVAELYAEFLQSRWMTAVNDCRAKLAAVQVIQRGHENEARRHNARVAELTRPRDFEGYGPSPGPDFAEVNSAQTLATRAQEAGQALTARVEELTRALAHIEQYALDDLWQRLRQLARQTGEREGDLLTHPRFSVLPARPVEQP